MSMSWSLRKKAKLYLKEELLPRIELFVGAQLYGMDGEKGIEQNYFGPENVSFSDAQHTHIHGCTAW